jgi:hypothetical protein
MEALYGLIATLKSLPSGIVPKEHVNTSEPKTLIDLPHITVSCSDIKETPLGVGGVLAIKTLSRGKASKSTGYRAAMTILIDVWAKSGTKTDGISEGVSRLIFDNRIPLRRSGFVVLSINRIGEVVSTGIPKTKTTSVAVWKRRLEYRCIYEQVSTKTEKPRRIIDIQESISEKESNRAGGLSLKKGA